MAEINALLTSSCGLEEGGEALTCGSVASLCVISGLLWGKDSIAGMARPTRSSSSSERGLFISAFKTREKESFLPSYSLVQRPNEISSLAASFSFQ